jgi:purine-nucleoside phosphorylase
VVPPASTDVAAALNEAGSLPAVDWLVVCGSGMGRGLVEEGGVGLDVVARVPLRDLGLPAPSVQGHGHALVFGTVGNSTVCFQTGRLHPYEGHSVQVCTAAMDAVLARWEPAVVLTCAVGALNPDLVPGQLVSLRDQINLFGPTPLTGARFVDCSRIYSPPLRQRVQEAAGVHGEVLPEVVYAHARGPQYETPAETDALRRLGGDIVGMSTTYEGILAAAYSAPACAVGVVTNAAGAVDLSHEEVQLRSEAARGRLAGILGTLLASPP